MPSNDLEVLLRSRVPIVVVESRDEARVLTSLARACGSLRCPTAICPTAQVSTSIGPALSTVGARLPSLFDDETGAVAALRDLVVRRAQGNPFYAEELLNYVQAQEIDASNP